MKTRTTVNDQMNNPQLKPFHQTSTLFRRRILSFAATASLFLTSCSAADKAPSFIKVNRTYWGATTSLYSYEFTVIELGDGSWVKARGTLHQGVVSQVPFEGWLNLSLFIRIDEEDDKPKSK